MMEKAAICQENAQKWGFLNIKAKKYSKKWQGNKSNCTKPPIYEKEVMN